jgi:hypothetical protein
VDFSDRISRPRALPVVLLAGLLALVALLAVGCGNDDRPAAGDPSPAAGDGYRMPAGWPLKTFPLPPDATTSGERVTDELVFFHLEGVTPDAAKAFYDKTLPGFGIERSRTLLTDPASYAGKELEVRVHEGDLGDSEIYLTRSLTAGP